MQRRVTEAVRLAWPLLQGTTAATLAWVLAKHVLGHPEPFFAPVAAVIALNASLGERGLNAVRLLQGVIVGIIVGEVVLNTVGDGWVALALATFIAMAIATSIGGARITIAQAAVGAILVVAIGDVEAGVDRLIDALVGAATALVFSQLLFTPQPLALVRRAEGAALREMTTGLELTAEAMSRGDDELGEEALRRLRTLRDQLTELARTRAASGRIVRRSAAWRSQRSPVVREVENAGHLDLLGGTCLVLTRVCLAEGVGAQETLIPRVRELAAALSGLGEAPGDQASRQQAVDRALAVARHCATARSSTEPSMAAALVALDLVAADIMIFAGVDPIEAAAAAHEQSAVLKAPALPPASRIPFRRDS